MKIKNNIYKFVRPLTARKTTTCVVLHHSATSRSTARQIHKWHIANGWAGIGYHFVIRKNGKVVAGRPIDTVGAHCSNHNSYTIGICFEGNFDKETMPVKQYEAGRELIKYLKKLYPSIKEVKLHRELMATACPGKNFNTSIRKGVI